MLLFHNSLSTTDTFLQNLWFFTKNTAPVRSPLGDEHSVLHIQLKSQRDTIFKQMIEKIPVEVVPISWSLFQFE